MTYRSGSLAMRVGLLNLRENLILRRFRMWSGPRSECSVSGRNRVRCANGNGLQLRHCFSWHEFPCSERRLGHGEPVSCQPCLPRGGGHQEREDALLRGPGLRSCSDLFISSPARPAGHSCSSSFATRENSRPLGERSTLLKVSRYDTIRG